MKKVFFVMAMALFVAVNVSAEELSKGYRGFVYANYLTGNDGVYKKMNDSGFGAYTTHGYQFNSHIFVGGGVGVQYHKMDYFYNGYSVPCYVDFRADFLDKAVTPFFEMKSGYSAGDFDGVFLSPGIGVRIDTQSRIAINIFASYAAQQYKYTEHYSTKRAFDHNLNVGVGIEF